MDELNGRANGSIAMTSPSPMFNGSKESSTANEYCGRELKSFRNGLESVYGTLTTVTCSLGLLTNVLTILVLTRKNMSRSSTNALLTAIAASDLLFLVTILTYNVISYDVIHLDVCLKNSYAVKMLSLVVLRLALTSHSISVVLTLILAVWRYIAVTYPLKIREWCSLYRTSVAIVVSYVAVPIGSMMVYMSRTVARVEQLKNESSALSINVGGQQQHDGRANSCLVYDIEYTELAKLGNWMLRDVAFWLYGVLFKIIPSIALLVFSLILVRALYNSSRQRSKLTQNSSGGSSLDRSCERTTKMLLAVLLLFLITELPQGVLLTLSAVLGKSFYDSCYSDLVEVNDLLEIVNSSFNFLFYYAMSKQFRRTFLRLFVADIFHEKGSSSTKSQESTTTQLETNC